MRLPSLLLDLVLPQRCQLCYVPSRTPICSPCTPKTVGCDNRCRRCWEPLPFDAAEALCASCRDHAPPWEQLRYAWGYEGASRELLRRAKYQPNRPLARSLAVLAARVTTEIAQLPQTGLLVPVPPRKPAFIRRGFHLPLLFARALQRTQRSMALAPFTLSWVRPTQPQASLPAAKRLRNVRGALRVIRDLRGQHVVLVDDVVTTGATLAAACEALFEMGAPEISVVVMARATHQRWHSAFPGTLP